MKAGIADSGKRNRIRKAGYTVLIVAIVAVGRIGEHHAAIFKHNTPIACNSPITQPLLKIVSKNRVL